MSGATSMNKETNYWNPYLAGFLLGLILLASFLIAGRGIGVSGAISQSLVHGYETLGLQNQYLTEQKNSETLFSTWIVIEVIGILIGAFVSARLAGRYKSETVKGKGVSNQLRIRHALLGGVLMGLAARLARGCTSGQALSGGALLSVGSWAFMIAIFIGAYVAVIFVKRYWR